MLGVVTGVLNLIPFLGLVLAEAIAALKDGLARHPEDREILTALATINRDAGDPAAALTYAEPPRAGRYRHHPARRVAAASSRKSRRQTEP
ncbi:hypothetical protein B4Q13_21820 [Lacticaseibacillus rhamnosus]